ncbi:hypothetical protein Y032_0042g610 [Ancylostoma ceylanicum]|uniref:DNA2/NAM7 helicase-like C-terminal domain-containing protein n=1 Tax=Ancylostoma ceylanicum TaxID=53326 RepID=A0A016UFJ3_9BILA|nr:hypothetical protein Y032_0042g610 [Ancylostoma ceylanicum]
MQPRQRAFSQNYAVFRRRGKPTFRTHPAPNTLPNSFIYDGTLVDGITAADRQLLKGVVRFSNPEVPLVFVDVKETSVEPASHSHYSPTKASKCQALVRRLLQRAAESSIVALITSYKEQHRYL